MTDDRFNELVGGLDYPMLIATTALGDERAGCLVGFATQASIDPPRFLVCLSERNRTLRLARRAPAIAVHFVPATAPALAELFGGQTGDDIDKFAQCEWKPGPHGVPLLSECPSWFVGAVLEQVPLGDHVGFLLDPVEARGDTRQEGLRFRQAQRIEPGHEA